MPFSAGGFVRDSISVPLRGITIKNIWLVGGGNGILLSGTTGARISDVTIVETVWDGLSIYDSMNTRIENSVFLKDVDMILDPMYENMYHGAIPLESVKNVVITGYSFYDHFNAIVLRDATDTTISSNYFHNTRGVMYHSARGTKIYNNYLSVVTIDSDNPTNALNTTLQPGNNSVGGTKMGGNYWYTDDGKGDSQTCVDENHSGRCDRPYVIDICTQRVPPDRQFPSLRSCHLRPSGPQLQRPPR